VSYICLAVKAQKLRAEHRELQFRERKHLWDKREFCVKNPKEAIIIEIDGMDQRKTELPRIADRPKALDRCEVIKNHIIGVLVNGEDFSAISHREHWRRDPNMTVLILFQVLKSIPRPWPKTLYLQLDNCISENKNAVMFFICSLLVHLNVFETVPTY
jgi:hypothetical protein